MPDRIAGEAPGEAVRITLVVNTRDEAERLPALFDSVEGVDEIVVGDMESSDETRSIAEGRGAHVLALPHAGFCEPGRMPAIRAASSPWILLLDADERLPAGALDALRAVLSTTPASVSGYRVRRINRIGGRPIVGSGWEVDAEMHARVFRREDVTWPERIHAQPTFTGELLDLAPDGPIVIDHENFDDFAHLLEKLNRYSTIEASQLLERGERPTLPMALRFGLEEVMHRYDPEADGSLSLALAFAMFGYRLTIGVKAAEAEGWQSDAVIARTSMSRAVNAFWSTLRICELARAIDLDDPDDGSDPPVAAIRMTNAIWAEMPPDLSNRTVELSGSSIDGPWAELRADGLGRATRLVEAVASARAALHREQRRATEAEVAARDAVAEANETRRLFEELVLSTAAASERLQSAELALADAQARVADLEAALDRTSATTVGQLRAELIGRTKEAIRRRRASAPRP